MLAVVHRNLAMGVVAASLEALSEAQTYQYFLGLFSTLSLLFPGF